MGRCYEAQLDSWEQYCERIRHQDDVFQEAMRRAIVDGAECAPPRMTAQQWRDLMLQMDAALERDKEG